MARIEVQSGTDKDCVSKLSYQVTGSVCIVYHTGRVCYCVKRLSNPRSSKMKYMVEDLYTLSTSLLPCEQIDGRDTRYLNHSRQPTINPLKNSLDGMLYNDIFFSSPSLTLPPKWVYNPKTLQFPLQCSIKQFTSVSYLHKESST